MLGKVEDSKLLSLCCRLSTVSGNLKEVADKLTGKGVWILSLQPTEKGKEEEAPVCVGFLCQCHNQLDVMENAIASLERLEKEL